MKAREQTLTGRADNLRRGLYLSAIISPLFFRVRNNNPDRFGGQPQKLNVFGELLIYVCFLGWLYFVYGADIETTAA